MASPSRLKAALRRLEARRAELERQIIQDLEAKFFSDDSSPIAEIVTSHPITHATGMTIGELETCTAPNSHITVTWFEA